MLKNNKGITLASLVITVIVLLIIASVGTASGVSAFNYIKFNNAKAQFQTMQSHVNSWNEEYKSMDDEQKEKWLAQHSEDLTKSDETIRNQTLNGEEPTGYRYFKSDDIKDKLDIDGISHNFLINISTRSVLLFGGIEYQGKTYYSAEDFGINIVKFEEIGSEDKITFAEPVIQDNKIIIYNIIFPNNMSVSKYNVQYKLSDATNWSTLTSDKKVTYTFIDEDGNEQVDNDAWTIERSASETYNIRITTASEDIVSNVRTFPIAVEETTE